MSQLKLRAELEHAGKIHHDYVFFQHSGEPIRCLNYPYVRWRHTLQSSLKLRYRKPYCARHSSVSWNLMIGKNPLWVAKQHGHSVTTMLRVYTAWADGAIEADTDAIKHAMEQRPARGSPNAPLGLCNLRSWGMTLHTSHAGIGATPDEG